MSTKSSVEVLHEETVNQTGNPNPTAAQKLRTAESVGWTTQSLQTIRLRRTLRSDLRKAQADRHKLLNNTLVLKQKTAKERHKLAKFIYNSVKSKDASAIKKANADWKKLQKEQASLEGKLTELSQAKYQEIIKKAGASSHAGVHNARAVLETMQTSSPLAGEAAYLDSQNYKDMNTTKKLFDAVNAMSGGTNPIQMDSRGIVTNVEQLKDPENSPLLALGYDPGSLDVLFKGEYNIFDGYNLNRTKLVEAFGESNARMAQIGEALEIVDTKGFEEEASEAVENLMGIQKYVAVVDEPLSGFFSADDAQQTKLANEHIAIIEADIKDTEGQIALLDSLPSEVKKKKQSGIALSMGNPNFQAWCADNGFTDVGEADVCRGQR
jgi:cob(I)alamin adenosyltransferase